MSEDNSLIDRIERLLEKTVDIQLKQTELIQQLANEQIKQTELYGKLELQQLETTEKLDALIRMVDDWIRRPPQSDAN